MITEAQVIERLRNRLLALGYPADALRAEVRTDYSRSADLVVYETGKPKVVFEVKANLDPLSLADEERLPFNPAVRQAQFLASELGAPYFAVFDDEQILWFDIDARDGRPRLLSDPIGPSAEATPVRSSDDPETALRLVYALYDLVIGIWEVPKTLAFVGITLLSKLRAELLGGSPAEQLSMLGHQERYDVPLQTLYKEFKSKDFEYFTRAFLMLDGSTLSQIPFAAFARALDEVLFIRRKDIGVFKLPPWLVELIAILSQPGSTDSILDIYSNYGDGVAAISKVSQTVRITSVTPNNISYLWDLLKRLRLGLSPTDLIYANLLQERQSFLELQSQSFDRVLVMPPLGLRLKRGGKPTTSEEFFLSTALDWLSSDRDANGRVVAVLPENFLFSQRHQQARDSILERMRLRAVISLQPYMPLTAVRGNIVVLDGGPNTGVYQRVIMVRLVNEDTDVLADSRRPLLDHKLIRTLVALLSDETGFDSQLESDRLWFVDTSDLLSKSWTITSHMKAGQFSYDSLFPTIPLGQIAELRKGSPLTIDPYGHLFVIGPASVRRLSIDLTKLDRTTPQRLSKRPVIAKSGDVLIHAIGDYRGQAVAVGSDFEGFYVSRNIVIARPNSAVILPQFLAIVLNGEFVRQQLSFISAGSVITQLTVEALDRLLIPIPDMETQQVIIARVEEILGKMAGDEERLQALIDTSHKGGAVDV